MAVRVNLMACLFAAFALSTIEGAPGDLGWWLSQVNRDG